MTGSGGYEIGKGKPPKATRFKPGQSGNPKGRPKGRKNFATEIKEVLKAPVPVTENGCTRKVTSTKATLMRLRKKALEGDGRSIDRLLELAHAQQAEEAAVEGERKLSAVEDEIFARYVVSQAGQRDDDTEGTDDEPEVRDE